MTLKLCYNGTRIETDQKGVNRMGGIRSSETTYREMPFADSLKYLTAIALTHQNISVPVIGALYGEPGAGKTTFARRLKEEVGRRGKDDFRLAYTPKEDDPRSILDTFLNLLQGNRCVFPVILFTINDSVSSAAGDILSIECFRRFPEIVFLITPSPAPNLDFDTAFLRMLAVRNKLAHAFEIPFLEPECIVIRNPH